MIDTPAVVQTEPQLTAVIQLIVPRDQIRQAMDAGTAELRSILSAQGLQSTGPWFTHHFRRPAETFDFEICVPVASEVAPAGRVKASLMAGARTARAVYHGGYEGLGQAWGHLHAWITANGHTPAANLWERYLIGPESSPDPAAWRTELNRPLLD